MKAKRKSPKATRPNIPGYGLPKTKKGLLSWKWAEDRLRKSRQYWIATARPEGRPHVMVVWALWLNGSLYFSTGSKSRQARNLAKNPHCTMCTEKADEAVILEGMVETEKNVESIRGFLREYGKKYKWDMSGMVADRLNLKAPGFRLRRKLGF